MSQQNNPAFPQQEGSEKIHGTTDLTGKKEKYIRDSGKIEDYAEKSDVAKMKSDVDESADLTDRNGEEKKEDYINTDERKKDLNQRGL